MPKSAEPLLREELIGLPVAVASAPDPGHVGLSGVLVDETRETFVVGTGGSEKVIAKRGAVFTFQTGSGPVHVPGDAVAFRPEDRIKKARLRA